jgi:hypothetical protein
MKEKPTGLNPHISLDFKKYKFNEEEQIIINKFAENSFVSFARSQLFKNKRYGFVFVHLKEELKELFKVNYELLILFINDNSFSTRTNDFVDKIIFEFQNRIEKQFYIIVADDVDIEKKVKDVINKYPDTRIIIPYTYQEILDNSKSSIDILNKIKHKFYGKDLFAFENPLQNDAHANEILDSEFNLLILSYNWFEEKLNQI